jgi:putative NADH-flavin reductase
MSRLLVLGATGGTGRQIVAHALEAGHEVTAVARRHAPPAPPYDRLRAVSADLTNDAGALAEAMKGQGVVISALGKGQSFRSERLIQRSMPTILSAMRAQGVRRLIFTSALGVGPSIQDAPLVPRLMIRFLLGDIYADKVAGERLIEQSDLDWTIVRPPQLTDGPLTRTYRTGERLVIRGMPSISRADVAHFILSEVERAAHVRKAVLIAR